MNKFADVNRVIFDLDNTLIKHDFDRENICIAKHFGVEGNQEFKRQLDSMFSNNTKYLKGKIITKEFFISVIEKLMPILGSIGKSGKDLLDIIDMYHSGSLMDGAIELLEYLKEEGYQMVIFTNWFSHYQINILRNLGIIEYFERVYAWDDYYAKPNHFAMIRALDNTNPKNNVMIGDSMQSDISLAKSEGLRTIGFNVDYSKHKKVIRADVDVINLIDIKNYL